MKYLFFESKETHIREISNQLKISSSAVKREIDNLESVGVIEKEGNKIKLNRKNNIVDELKSIFVKTDYIVYSLEDLLKKNKKIEFALVFGSFSRGDYHTESDIDVLIIGNVKLSETFKLFKPLEEETGREINPVVWSIKSIQKKKDNRLMNEIFAGKVIMIKGEEDELRKIVKG